MPLYPLLLQSPMGLHAYHVLSKVGSRVLHQAGNASRCLLHDASPHVFVEQRMASGELKEETCELKEARLNLHFFPLTLSRGLSHTPDLLPPGLVDERNLARGISVHLFAHKLQSVWFTRKASSVSRWSNHRLCSVSCCCNAFCCCNATFCCCCADICS